MADFCFILTFLQSLGNEVLPKKSANFRKLTRKKTRVSPPSKVNSIVCLTLNIPYILHNHLQADMYVFDYLSIVYLPDVWKDLESWKKSLNRLTY